MPDRQADADAWEGWRRGWRRGASRATRRGPSVDGAENALGVAVADQLLVRFGNPRVVLQQLHVFPLHAPARIVVRIIRRKQELGRAEILDRVGQFRLLGLYREQEIGLEIINQV